MGAQDADGRAVAQLVMMAASVTSHGTDYPAYCALAPIVDRTGRAIRCGSQIRRSILQSLCTDTLPRKRVHEVTRVMYAMPHWKWAALFHRLQTVRYCTFPLWSRPLPFLRPESIGHGYSVSGQYIWKSRQSAVDRRIAHPGNRHHAHSRYPALEGWPSRVLHRSRCRKRGGAGWHRGCACARAGTVDGV